jgi:ATP-binding cassette, subfamily B, multidrug efflux pump
LKELQYLNKFFYKYKWRLLLGIVFVTLSNYFAILIPKKIASSLDFIQDKIVEVKASGNETSMMDSLSKELFIYGLIVVAFMILKGIFMFLMRQTIIVTSRLIEYDMRKEVYDHLQSQDQFFFKNSRTGDLMARISEDVSKVRNYLGPGILYGINLISLFIMTIVAMFNVDARLAMFTLIPLPLLSLSIYYVSSLINQKSAIIAKHVSKLTSISQEVYSGIRVVKSYGKESKFNDYFAKESEVLMEKSMDLAKVNSYFFPLMILLINASTLIVLYVGGNLVNNGSIKPSAIAEFIIYVNMLTWPVTSIGWIASIIQEAEASQQRINELLDSKSSLSVGKPLENDLKGQIEFKKVNFIYEQTGIHALKDINFEIEKGSKIAFVGRTASGKSTVAELILRMYDVNNGVILIDNVDIKEIKKEDIRKHIGFVPQDVFLFSDTVSNNIKFGNPDASQEEVELMAKNLSVFDDIMRMPDGFNTIVGERGVTLSGGQKQRISIARALIKNPDIVILDDCLSAVDLETEQRIFSYFNEELDGKTLIVITHRLTSLVDYDQIYFLEEGAIMENGTHDQLMKNQSYYFDLYNLSLAEVSQEQF